MTLALFNWGRAAGGAQVAMWGRYTALLAHHRSGAWSVDLYHGTKRTRHEELSADTTPADARTTAEQFLLDEQGPEVRELVRRARVAQMAGAGTRWLRAVGGGVGSGGKRRKAMIKNKAKHRGGGKSRSPHGTTLFYARQDPKGRWKHLMAISDGRLVLFEMEPAIIAGWNCKRTTVQSGDDWDGMSAASIVAFKQQSGDNLLRPAVEGEVEWMQSKLAATGGKKRHAGGKRRKPARPTARSPLTALVADINRLVK